jgi:hypothetical protein
MSYKHSDAFYMAFELMPDTFSTHEFNTSLRELNVPDNLLESVYHKRFLNSKATRSSRSMWRKKSYSDRKSDSRKRYSLNNAMGDFPIYEQALKAMPDRFTSSDLSGLAQENGANPYHTREGAIGFWLQDRDDVERISTRTWVKKGVEPQSESVPDITTEEQAVALLKSLGYRIMKPTTQWEEL